MKVLALIALLSVLLVPMAWQATTFAYYDVRLWMKSDEIERCMHIAGGYRTFGHNVVCVDVRR